MSLFVPKTSDSQSSTNKQPFISPAIQQKTKSEGESKSSLAEMKDGESNPTSFIQRQPTLQAKSKAIETKTIEPVSQDGEFIQKEEQDSTEGKVDMSTTPVKESSSSYWTHSWHNDRFGNEALFIWEVGGKRKYSNADKGYSYIREKAALVPGDTGYDLRFERYRHRPQEMSDPKLGWWMKRTPGWDNPEHADNGIADFTDLAEFSDTPENKMGTGFYYMGFVFDPQIFEKLEEQKQNSKHQEYIGNETNYRGYVKAESGIVLHDTPTPADEAYNSKRGNEDFIIQFNQPITVIAEANENNEGWVLIKNAQGERGWIERRHISKEPEIKSDSAFDSYTVKSGDKLEDLIKSYYESYPSTTGNDRRTIALAIYLYNKDKPGSGVYRNYDKYKKSGSWKDYVDPWMKETRANYQSVELYAGGEVILPPAGYIAKMVQMGEVEKRPDFVNVMIDSGRTVQGFIAGVGIGFWDAIIETGEDLYNMIVDIFTGEIFNQIADMFNMFMEKGLSGIWDMIKEFASGTWEEVKAAWNNPNPYQKGQYFGEIVGMILFEVVLALLTWGIGSAVRNSARVQKVLKWFPNMNKKSVVPDDIDNYADDIRKMNGDRDVDLDRDKKDRDKDNDKESDEDKAENAKALIAAKAYVKVQDDADPSPDVDIVVGAINKMPVTKLKGGKKYKARANGKGAGHFEIYYNPPVKKDYTEGGKENDNKKSSNLDANKTRQLSKSVPAKYRKWGQCDSYANSLKSKMKQQNLDGVHLRIDSRTDFMPSKSYDLHNGNISENGFHEAIKVGDTIFDNLHPEGVKYDWWAEDLDIVDLTNEGFYNSYNKSW